MSSKSVRIALVNALDRLLDFEQAGGKRCLCSQPEYSEYDATCPYCEAREAIAAATDGCAFHGAKNITCPKCLSQSPFHEE